MTTQRLREEIKKSLFDTSEWKSICDLTLSLKQVLWVDCGWKVSITEDECKRAFHHFMNLLNCEVFGSSFRKRKTRLKVLPVLEKEEGGRFHLHAAIEPPEHLSQLEFKSLINRCWSKTHWGYNVNLVRFGADQGWIDYQLKPGQKSGLETWSDCIDWKSFHNPTDA
jgi:hypothetical protein